MKQCLIVIVISSLLFGLSIAASAQQNIEQSAQFMETLVIQIKSLLSADNVLGKPLEFHGTTIIPITGYGFGFGGAIGSNSVDMQPNEGVAGGAGGGIAPTAILVISKDGEVQVLPAKKGMMSEVVSAIVPIAMEGLELEKMRLKEKKAPVAEPAAPEEAEGKEESSN